MTIRATQALFIKLGERGRWESECLAAGTLRFGYIEIPLEVCVAENWDEVKRLAMGFSPNGGVAKFHATQVRYFHKADETVLWITFHADRLWWCFSGREIVQQPNNEKLRRAIGGWCDSDQKGTTEMDGDTTIFRQKMIAVLSQRGEPMSYRALTDALWEAFPEHREHMVALSKDHWGITHHAKYRSRTLSSDRTSHRPPCSLGGTCR